MTLNVRLRAVILFSGIFLFGLAGIGYSAGTMASQQARIIGIERQETADGFLVTIRSEQPPTYTMYELFNPLRIILDIADATIAESARLPLEFEQGPVTAITGRILDDQEPFITRIEIVLAEDRAYAVDRDENDIKVKFTGPPTRMAGSEGPAASVAAREVRDSSKNKATQSLRLADVAVTTAPSETRVLLQAGAPIAEYRKVQLPRGSGRPDRLYIDIPRLRMTDNFKHLTVDKALARVRMAHRGSGLRVVFDSGLDGPFEYDIETVPQGLLITVPEPSPEAMVAELIGAKDNKSLPEAPVAASGKPTGIEPVIAAAAPPRKTAAPQQKRTAPTPAAPTEKAEALPALADELGMAGYNTQKISIDFFKIDLHNVFRLIGEISGRNIVVDEAVSGTLTLALNEVPWDFVLDVVLNLKDLQKEERFNTIVISPKNKDYSWPKKPTDNLAIAADGTLLKQEAISIKQKLETPKEIIEAKKLILLGNEQYRAGRHDAALPLYEQAFAKWPQNQQLAERIVATALVQLGKNAKAVHYAKAVLELEPGNSAAALHAAIALANMKKTDEAKQYFDLAIASPQPSSQALSSYAAFCEENDSLEAALRLLAMLEEIHGDTLESMIAKARLQDKLGRRDEANEEYQAILLSGFEIPADLKRFIKTRMAVANR